MRIGALRIALIYVMLGVLWITLSNKALFLMQDKVSPFAFIVINNSKGVVFVIITGALLWKMIKQDDERLTDSEKQYRNMYEANPLPMWIYDLNTFKIVSVNHSAIENYGYTKEAFLQLSILDLRPKEDHGKVLEAVNSVGENVKQSGIWVHKKADGAQFYVRISSQRILFNNKPHVMTTAQDINERVEFEQKLKKLNTDLKEKQAKLSETQQIAKVAGWEYHVKDDVMLWSDEMYILTETLPTQGDNMIAYFSKHIHPDDKLLVKEALDILIKTGEQLNLAHRLLLEDGTIHYVRQIARLEYLLGIPHKIIGSMQDITELKLLEQERNKYLFSLEDTLNTINEGFFALDRNLKFTKVNLRFEEETGFNSESIIGKNLVDVFPEVTEDSPGSKFRRVLNDGVALKFEEYSYNLQKWLSLSVYPTPEGLAIYFQDITAQKEKDLQLKEALERYDTVSKATHDVIYDYNLTSNKIIYNTSLSQLVNCDLDKIDYNISWWRSLIHPDDLPDVIVSQEKVLLNREANWRCEYRINCGDESYKYVYDQGYFIYDANSKPIRLIGAIKDIDALKRSDEENKRLAEIITKVNNMVVVMDADDRITWVNKAFEDYTGYNCENIIGRQSSELFSCLEIAPQALDRINESKSRFETFSIEVVHYLHREGYQWLEIEYTPLYNDCGVYTGYIAVHQNITTRKEKEERINQQNKTLQEIAWLSSHEVRRPVASILGLVYLAKDINTPEDRDEIMQMINRCAEELDGIVHTISQKVNEEVDLQT